MEDTALHFCPLSLGFLMQKSSRFLPPISMTDGAPSLVLANLGCVFDIGTSKHTINNSTNMADRDWLLAAPRRNVPHPSSFLDCFPLEFGKLGIHLPLGSSSRQVCVQ